MDHMARNADSETVAVADDGIPIQNLLAAAKQDGQDVTILCGMLHSTNTHPKLPGFVQSSRHLQEVLPQLPEDMDETTKQLLRVGWATVLVWIAKDPQKLAERVFPGETPRVQRLREKFLQSKAPNPIREKKRHGLYCTLWASHPDGQLQGPFRLLQAYLLVSHIAIMRKEVTFDAWQNGFEPEAGFYESLHRAGWHVRRFTFKDVAWHKALGSIPKRSTLENLPAELRKLAKDMVKAEGDNSEKTVDSTRIVQEISMSLCGIAGFIKRGSDPEYHKRKSHVGGTGNPRGGGRQLGGDGDNHVEPVSEDEEIDDDPGAGDVDNDFIETAIALGDVEDQDGHLVTLHFPVRLKRDAIRYKELLAAGDHPAEELSLPTIVLAEDKAAAASAKGGAVERANQLLPWAFEDLSPAEIAPLLCRLRESASAGNPEHLKIHAVLCIMLYTGASLNQARSILLFSEQTAMVECDLALRVADDLSSAVWRVSALPLDLKCEEPPPVEKARTLVEFFDLPDAVGGSVPVLNFLSYLRDIAHEPFAQISAMREKPLQLFTDDIAWYRAQLKLLFEQHLRVTSTRLSRVMFQRIVEHTGGDVVSAALLTSTDHRLASVVRYYATPEVRHLQQVYLEATNALSAELARAGYAQEKLEFTGLTECGVSVGSPLCPNLASVQEAIQLLIAQLEEPLPRGTEAEIRPIFARRHNLYTLYSVWLSFGFAIGSRGVHTPYLHSSAVDSDSGFAVFSDKDDGSGYRDRLIWIPEGTLEQMRLYEAYLSRIERKRKLPRATLKMPCYFLSDELKVCVVRPGTLVPFLDAILPFPANVARHFLCTEMNERGVNIDPELIDAWAGHHWLGQEPWGDCSSFNYSYYRHELKRHLVPFLAELGIKPIALGGE
jgi:hypothetical protein